MFILYFETSWLFLVFFSFFFPFKMWSVTVPCLEQKGYTKTSWLEVKICMFIKLSRWFFCTFKFCNICTRYFILSRRLKLSHMNLLNLGFYRVEGSWILQGSLLLHPHFPLSLHLLKCLPFFSRVKCSCSTPNSVTFLTLTIKM